jgi:hypothetical protein
MFQLHCSITVRLVVKATEHIQKPVISLCRRLWLWRRQQLLPVDQQEDVPGAASRTEGAVQQAARHRPEGFCRGRHVQTSQADSGLPWSATCVWCMYVCCRMLPYNTWWLTQGNMMQHAVLVISIA